MSNCPENVKRKINSIIEEMSDKHWLFFSNPGHDFMRQSLGKLSFADTMRLVLIMGKSTSSTEMIRFFT